MYIYLKDQLNYFAQTVIAAQRIQFSSVQFLCNLASTRVYVSTEDKGDAGPTTEVGGGAQEEEEL